MQTFLYVSMQTFFLEQMDLIYFYSGIALFFLGFVSYLFFNMKRQELSWSFLSLFGMFRGLYTLVVLLQMIFGTGTWLTIFAAIFNILSFSALLEFGRRGILHQKKLMDFRIHVPFFAVLFFVWWLSGWGDIGYITRCILGFPSAVIAGIVFWRWSKKNYVKSYFICPVAIAFWFYALSQLFYDGFVFFHSINVPIELFRLLFCIVIFQGVWFQYEFTLFQEFSAQGILKKRYLKIKEVVFTILFLLLTTIVGSIFINRLGFYEQGIIENESDKISGFGSLVIKHKISDVEALSLSFSVLPEIIKNFSQIDLNSDILNIAIDGCQKVVGDGVCYIMNKEGVVVVSSNRNSSDSFLGKNYAFRSYFQDALDGKAGRLFALGTTSLLPGYYASSPIRTSLGGVAGVFVVKANLSSIEKDLDGLVFVSPEGVVFLSGKSELRGKSLVELSEETKQMIIDKKLYGQISFNPLFQVLPKDGDTVRVDGSDYFIHTTTLSDDGWQLFLFNNLSNIKLFRLFGFVTSFLFYFLLMVFVGLVQVLQRSNNFSYFASAIDTSQDAIIGLDLSGKILSWNFGAEKIYGYTKEQAVGKLIALLLPISKNKKMANFLSILQNGQVLKNFEMQHYNKSGSLVDVSITVSPTRDQDDILMGASMISRDISSAKQLERTKSEFVSITSHQLRTPLTGIKWFSELLLHGKTGVLSKKTREYVQEISDTNQRMINLVNDLLEVSHIDDKGKYHLEKIKMNFALIISDMVDQQRILASVKDIKINLDANCLKTNWMDVDRTKMDQVLQNILNNAIKFSHPKGIITVSCNKKNKQLVCSVKDRGMGIPLYQQVRIFEKFFRADNSVNAGSGTGLGLYIAKNIIEQHGGKIWFESKENKGTTVYFSLPIATE